MAIFNSYVKLPECIPIYSHDFPIYSHIKPMCFAIPAVFCVLSTGLLTEVHFFQEFHGHHLLADDIGIFHDVKTFKNPSRDDKNYHELTKNV